MAKSYQQRLQRSSSMQNFLKPRDILKGAKKIFRALKGVLYPFSGLFGPFRTLFTFSLGSHLEVSLFLTLHLLLTLSKTDLTP